MGRLKRAQKLARQLEVKPAPKPVAVGVVAEKVVAALCPVCGRSIPKDRTVKIGYTVIGHTPYFETIDWLPDKAFGLKFTAAGRGSFKDWSPIQPEDDLELFDAVRSRFLTALGEWLAKGWIDPSQVHNLLEGK